ISSYLVKRNPLRTVARRERPEKEGEGRKRDPEGPQDRTPGPARLRENMPLLSSEILPSQGIREPAILEVALGEVGAAFGFEVADGLNLCEENPLRPRFGTL